MSRRSRSRTVSRNISRQRRSSATRSSLHLPSYRKPVLLSALPNIPFSDRQVLKRVRNYHIRKPVTRFLPNLDVNRFYNPASVLSSSRLHVRLDPFVCARRAIRREVIFASGRGGSRVARPRFTSQSKVKC